MFVMTAKVSKTKIAAIFVLLIALVVLLVMLLVGLGQNETPTGDAGIAGDSNDARLDFLAQHGWDANADPVKTQQVTIPEETENETFARYNQLQLSQGFDLTKLAGKTATRYVYELLNYPNSAGPVYATIFVSDGKIIGGDITDTVPGGKMHGFDRPG